MAEKRKLRKWYASDEEYRIIAAYAQGRGRSIGDFVRHTALSEITRHGAPKGLAEALEPLVERIVEKALSRGFPVRGNASGGKETGGGECGDA